jgi:hypothetical protein
MCLFALPYQVPAGLARLLRVETDMESTVKLGVTMLLAPLWAALLTAEAWHLWGWHAGVLMGVGSLPLALFTRYFYERRGAAWRDAHVFLVLFNRKQLKEQLLAEGERLANDIEALAQELGPRVSGI